MNFIVNILIFILKSRRSWWFTATCRTQARFIRTKLGSYWLGLSNLLSISVLAGVYGTVFKVGNFKNYAIYLGIGLVIWNYISSAITASSVLFENSSKEIKNSNIDPIFYVVEEWAFQFQTFAQSFGLVLAVLSILDFYLPFNLLIYSIPALLNLIIFLFWCPLLFCIFGTRFQDLYQLIPILMQLLFLLTPILYAKESLSKLSWIADYNLFYIILSQLRDSLIDGKFFIWKTFITFFINIIGTIGTLKLYKIIRKKIPYYI